MMMHLSVPVDEDVQQTLSFLEKVTFLYFGKSPSYWFASPPPCVLISAIDIDSSKAWRSRFVKFRRWIFSVPDRIISQTSFALCRIHYKANGKFS